MMITITKKNKMDEQKRLVRDSNKKYDDKQRNKSLTRLKDQQKCL